MRLLSKDPYVPISLGQRPIVLDAYMLWNIARSRSIRDRRRDSQDMPRRESGRRAMDLHAVSGSMIVPSPRLQSALSRYVVTRSSSAHAGRRDCR
jgi:hypothetical protein